MGTANTKAANKEGDKIDPSRFISFFDSILNKSDLNVAEIARRVGLPSRQAVYQIRSGHMKLPLNRVSAMASVLEVPTHVLFFYALEQYLSRNTVQLITESVVASLGITMNEKSIIDYIRLVSGNTDPSLDAKLMEKIQEAVK